MTLTMRSVALRSIIVVSAILAVLAAAATSHASPSAGSWTIALVALAFAIGAAYEPDGAAALLCIGLLLLHWLMVVEDQLSVLTPVAAALVVVLHSAASLESITPRGARLAPSTYLRWASRVALVAGAALLLWVVSLVADGIEHASNVVLVLGIGVLFGGGVWTLRVRMLGE